MVDTIDTSENTDVVTISNLSHPIYRVPPWNHPYRGASTKVLIVTSKRTGQLRRVIQTDNDEEFAHWENDAHPGENIYYMSIEEYSAFEGKFDEFKHHVAKHHGFEKTPHDDESRLAHVDPEGNVINVIHGDLSCGDHVEWHGEGHSLHHHKHVHKGWKHDGKNFIPPVEVEVSGE